MNSLIKYLFILFIKLSLISCASTIPFSTDSSLDTPIYKPPNIDYKYNKIPNKLNLIFLRNEQKENLNEVIEGFIDNYFSKTLLHQPQVEVLMIDPENINKVTCKNLVRNYEYSIIIDKNNINTINKKECLKQIHKPKSLLISLYTKDKDNRGSFRQILFDSEDDMSELLLHARNSQSKNAILFENQKFENDNSLANLWTKLGGKIKETIILKESRSYEDLIAKSLLLSESMKRKQSLSYLTGLKLGFTPRKREDIDSIILHTDIEKGKAINPAIAYNYAEDLNIYFLNTKKLNYKFNINKKDFEKITLIDFPINLMESSTFSSRGPMYAIGYDAYELYLLLNNPSTKNKYTYSGLSGQFLINRKEIIKRKGIIAKIENGDFKRFVATRKNLSFPAQLQKY